MPQPRSSIQPECLHLRQPAPLPKMQEICTSAEGSVKEKEWEEGAGLSTNDPEEGLHGVVERGVEVGEGDVFRRRRGLRPGGRRVNGWRRLRRCGELCRE